MVNRYDSLRSIFLEIFYEGAVVIDKRKLLGLMGKSHDRPTAWELLLSEWEDAGYNRSDLRGAVYDRNVILAFDSAATYERVSDWAI